MGALTNSRKSIECDRYGHDAPSRCYACRVAAADSRRLRSTHTWPDWPAGACVDGRLFVDLA